MNKQKAMIVTAAFSTLTAFVIYATFRLATPVFIALVGVFFAIGFAGAVSAFFKWLKSPSKTVEPEIEIPEIVQAKESFDCSDIIEEVKRNA